MNWLAPAAFAGLALMTVPVLVHLFARRNARTVRFPTLRFIDPVRAVAPRRARLTDLGLLALRLAIIVIAVAALAQPQWTASSDRGAGGPLVRVIVVDTSESVARQTPAGEPGFDVARREAARLVAEAGTGLIVETDRPFAELTGAVEWLASSGPGRHEIVVVSDFQRGTLTATDIAALPDSVGLVTVRVDVSGDVAPGEFAPPPLVVVAQDAERSLADATLRAATASLPTSATASRATIVVDFTSTVRDPTAVPDSPWMGDVLWALRNDGVDASRRADTLVIRPVSAPGTLDAALLIRRAARAASVAPDAAERDTATIADSVLRSWERPAMMSIGRSEDRSDGRWLWAIVLLLLVAEHYVRGGRTTGGARAAGAGEAGD